MAPPHNPTPTQGQRSGLNVPTRSVLRNNPLSAGTVNLSPIDPADGPELWLAVNSSRDHLQRWLPWVPFNDNPRASQCYAEACAKEWDEGKSLRFGIRHGDDNRLLGVVSLDNCVHAHRNCDLGYWLRHDATGHGYLTQATRACLTFAFDVVKFHRIRCAAATENHKSLAVVARLGFEFEGILRDAEHVDGRWVNHATFSVLAREWPT